VPAFLVVALYFLEQPWDQTEQGKRYLIKPVTWGIGILIAFLSYSAYIPLSGNSTSKFGSTFTSDLLWNRLWPNPTYPIGIFWGAVLVSLPLWLVIYAGYRQTFVQTHPLKWLGYAAMLAILFLGGLVVSVKIGGGSNLHNLDAYFVLLMTIAGYMFWGNSVQDRQTSGNYKMDPLPQWIITAAILVPVVLLLREGGVVSSPDLDVDWVDLNRLQELVSENSVAGSQVLFISERQLQVFNLVPEIPFIPEYEKIELMEMAMSGNEVYLERFYADIAHHRFALIVTDSVRTDMKDEIDSFSEEHNVWVEKVMTPLLSEYRFSSLGGRSSIFVLTPK
jgi:hypothetical protein